MTRAYLYYLRCSTKNRFRSIGEKLRRPRYLLGLLAMFGYFFLIFRNPGSRHAASGAAVARESTLYGFGVFYLLQVLLFHLFGSRRGLLFSPSEVQFLFPAPVTNRQVLIFKWMTAQIGLFISSLILSLIVSRYGIFSMRYGIPGFWVAHNVLYLHNQSMNLILPFLRERGRGGRLLARLPLILLLVGIAAAIVSVQPAGGDLAEVIGRARESVPVRVFLWPFASLVRPALAHGPLDLVVSLWAPLLLFGLFAALALIPKIPFHDRALESSERVAKLKTEGLDALVPLDKKKQVVKRPTALPLAPVGPVWRAIIWKNVLSLGRLPRRVWVGLGLGMAFMGFFMFFMTNLKGEGAQTASHIGLVLLAVLAYGSMLAPAMLRVDLRIDIPHFDVLKSMPIRGRDLIFGEVMGSVLLLFAAQAVLLLVAATLIRQVMTTQVGWEIKGPLLVAALPAAFAMDFIFLTQENLLALWLPSFVRFGRGMRQGFDQFGQNLLGALVRATSAILLLVAPGALGAGVGFAFIHWGEVSPWTAIAAASLTASPLLFLEGLLLQRASEGRYERFDLSAEKVTEPS